MTRPRLVVVEPHMDDAVVAVGGQLLHRRATHDLVVLTVVRWSEYTKDPEVRDRQAVSALRLAESERAAQAIGFRLEVMDERDFPIRAREEAGLEPGPRDAALEAAYKRFAPSSEELESLSRAISERLTALAPDEVWLPLGVGENPDHVRTGRACVRMLHTHPLAKASFYEDLAPFPPFAGHAERIVAALEASGELRRVEENIDDVLDDKIAASTAYASQFDMKPSAHPMSDMETLLSRRRIEVRYDVVRTPLAPLHSVVAFRPADVLAAKALLGPIDRTRVRHVTIARPIARESLALARLRAAFPNAQVAIAGDAPLVVDGAPVPVASVGDAVSALDEL